MLDCTPELAALLEAWRNDTAAAPYMVELYTWSLPSGAQIRWTSADADVNWNGDTFFRGPGISRSQISRQTGTSVSELDVTLYFDDSIEQNGIRLAEFIAAGGFFNATLLFERGYAAAPGSPIVGTLPKFSGRVTQYKDTGETQSTLLVSNWMSLLNVQVPINLWQPSCLHTLFDSGCGLNRADFAKNGIVQAGSDKLMIFTDISADVGYYNLGKIVFTTGANEGQSRTVKTQSAGVIVLVRGLPKPPASGDKFIAYPGCDLTQGTCIAKFNNSSHFKGYPDIPTNEMAAP